MRTSYLLALSIVSVAIAHMKAAEQAAEELTALGSYGCRLQSAGYRAGVHKVDVHVDGLDRNFLFFVPSSYRPQQQTAFWLLGPGAYATAARFMHVSGMLGFAESRGLLFVVLQSAQIEGLNVGLEGQALPNLPDDVAYSQAILRDVSRSMCINMERIHCVGYSRGARFCSRLASELSSFVAGIAAVGGVRFPKPNNASGAMPVIAFHGTKDFINPYWGRGDPSYWYESVPDAIEEWASFNGCKSDRWKYAAEHVVLAQNYNCRHDASVELVMIIGDGHTWAGSDGFIGPEFGHTTNETDASEMIWDFFIAHPRKMTCRTVQFGEPCYDAVMRVMREGLSEYREWDGDFNRNWTFEDVQSVLFRDFVANCPRPTPECTNSTNPHIYPPMDASSIGGSGGGSSVDPLLSVFSVVASCLILVSLCAACVLIRRQFQGFRGIQDVENNSVSTLIVVPRPRNYQQYCERGRAAWTT